MREICCAQDIYVFLRVHTRIHNVIHFICIYFIYKYVSIYNIYIYETHIKNTCDNLMHKQDDAVI